MPSSAQSARRSARAAGYVFPEHLREQARALPAQPGVYTFHGREGGLPLYIGKSVNLRTRVLDHLRTEEEAAMLRQSERISHLPMAGDLGAQLLEATMVKTHRPLYNRLLRRVPRQFSLRLYRGEVSVLHSGEVDLTSAPLLYGVYSSERSAREALRRLADDNRLCYSLLGLERLPAGRPCFRSMLGQCLGACCGRESVAEHQRRLSEALALLEVVQWPYAAPSPSRSAARTCASSMWLMGGSITAAARPLLPPDACAADPPSSTATPTAFCARACAAASGPCTRCRHSQGKQVTRHGRSLGYACLQDHAGENRD